MDLPAAPIRTVLIGHGYVGQTFHAPLITSVPGLSLDLIASRDEEGVHARWPGMRVTADYAAAAIDPDIDLVVIATPNDSHHPLARAALLAGKHVVIDKPFTVTLDEARDLVALAESRSLLLSVFHNRRWDGDFLSLKATLASGVLGPVREFISRFDRYAPAPRDRWRERPGPGSGLWFDLGPHVVDQALQLFGRPDTVTASFAALREGAKGVTDWAQVVLGYEGTHTRRVTLHVTRLAAWPAPRFEAHGPQGSWISTGLDVQEDQLKAGMFPGEAGWGEDDRPALQVLGTTAPTEVPRLPGDYRLYYQGLRDALRGQAPNPVPAHEALSVMEVMDLAQRSADEGRTLTLDGRQ